MKRAIRVPFTPPMECLSAERLPEGPGWVYELKLDGFRAQSNPGFERCRTLFGKWKELHGQIPTSVVAALKEALAARLHSAGRRTRCIRQKPAGQVSKRCRMPIAERRTWCSSSSMSSPCVAERLKALATHRATFGSPVGVHVFRSRSSNSGTFHRVARSNSSPRCGASVVKASSPSA